MFVKFPPNNLFNKIGKMYFNKGLSKNSTFRFTSSKTLGTKYKVSGLISLHSSINFSLLDAIAILLSNNRL